jgi:hypothetical protein
MSAHFRGSGQNLVIAAQILRSLPVGTRSVEALATSPEFARKESREYGLDHHGSRVVWHSHRISGEPLLLHGPDLAQSLPASASTRSCVVEEKAQILGTKLVRRTAKSTDIAPLGLSIVKRCLDKNAYFHGGSRFVPKAYLTTSTNRSCPLPRAQGCVDDIGNTRTAQSRTRRSSASTTRTMTNCEHTSPTSWRPTNLHAG